MLWKTHIRLAAVLLLMLSGPLAKGQEALLGLFNSPKGIGVTAMVGSDWGNETNIITLRTDFYGILGGRTQNMGVCVTYSHDYAIYQLWQDQFDLTLHAGAGGQIGYVHDWEKGLFVPLDRDLEHKMGLAVALVGNIGLRFDFDRLTLDLSFGLAPGIHLRTDEETGAVLLAFYRAGIYNAYYPQLNIMYRF
jgi:hypothetical protein